jgi:hypothetical protein
MKRLIIFQVFIGTGAIAGLTALILAPVPISLVFGAVSLVLFTLAGYTASLIKTHDDPYEQYIAETLNDARARGIRHPDDHKAITGRFGWNGIKVSFGSQG